MNIKKAIFFTFLMTVFGVMTCWGQEPNLTQFQRTPFLTNPGMVAAFDQPSVIINFRHHNHEAGTQYITSSISSFYPIFIGQHRIGFGVSILNDQAADYMSTTAGMAAVGVGIQISTQHLLSLGIQGGFYHQGLGNANGFSTDQQFINGVYMPNAPSGENFEKESTGYMNLSTGLFWEFSDSHGLRKIFAGLSIFNINEPDRGFVREDRIKYTWKGIAGWRVYQNEEFSISPAVRWIAYNNFHLWMGGSCMDFKLNRGSSDVSQLSLGLWYSNTNLGAATIELSLEEFSIGLSYDMPIGGELSHLRNNILEMMLAINFSGKNSKSKEEEIFKNN